MVIIGRYYNGDIEGKFWFGIQSSDDGEFFGAEALEPCEINYYVGDIDKVNKGVDKCITKLGIYREKLDEFFEKNHLYSNDLIIRELNIPIDDTRDILEWYARLELGLKIQKCMEENGECNFSAEI